MVRLRKRRGPRICCNVCGKVYRTEKWLNIHRKTHKVQERLFVCTEESCRKSYKKESNLIMHKTWHMAEGRRQALKTLVANKKKHRKDFVLKYPCVFCNFWTRSRSNVERHLEVRHNSRYKQSIHLVRAHADALEVQHHQLLLALEIEDSLTTVTLETTEEIYTPNDPTIAHEPLDKTLCSTCGRVFTTGTEYEKHHCEGSSNNSTYLESVTAVTEIRFKSDEYEFTNLELPRLLMPAEVQLPLPVECGPLDLSLNSAHVFHQLGSFSNNYQHKVSASLPSEKLVDPTDGINVLTLLTTKNVNKRSSYFDHEVEEPTMIFTFQDLLVLEQNLQPLYL